MEKRSTWPPISAILMTAESPARPPPITMIFGFDAIWFDCSCLARSLCRRCPAGVGIMHTVLRPNGLQWRLQKRAHGQRSHSNKEQSDGEAYVAESPPGGVAS